MTLQETRIQLDTACEHIFRVEQALSKDLDCELRKEGYRIRISIGRFQDRISGLRTKDDIRQELNPEAEQD